VSLERLHKRNQFLHGYGQCFLPLLVPPEITGDPIYGAQGKPGFYNHSGFAMNDQNCESCHGSLSGSANISGLMHNVAKVLLEGLTVLHAINIGGQAGHDVDITNMGTGAHANLNNRFTIHRRQHHQQKMLGMSRHIKCKRLCKRKRPAELA